MHACLPVCTLWFGHGQGIAGDGGEASGRSSGGRSGPSSHVAGADDGRASNPNLNWQLVRSQALQRFTVSGRIVMDADLFGDAEKVESTFEEQALSLEKAKQRLAELESRGTGRTVDLSQREYQSRIEDMYSKLEKAWDSGNRVLSLKIAIQCAKLISQPRGVPRFYPSMFFMCSSILDLFGREVFARLREKADATSRKLGAGPLPDDFTAADVGAETKETTRNWLYKTACIRELVPRLYIELALLECYRLIGETDFSELLQRLAHTCRGIGDPLVAAYARLYLARQASRLVGGAKERDCVWLCLQDQLYTWPETESPARLTRLERQGVTPEQYTDLFAPPLAWLVHQVTWRAPRDVFMRVIRLYKERCGNSVALLPILQAFDGTHYSKHIKDMVQLVRESQDKPSLTAPSDLFGALAEGLAKEPPAESMRPPFLHEAWMAVNAEQDPEAFLRASAALVSLLSRHYDESDLLTLLKAIAKRMRKVAKEHAERLAAAGGGDAGSGSGAAETGEAPALGATASSSGADGSGAAAARRVPDECLPHLERIMVALVSGGRADSGEGPRPAVITSDAFVTLLDLFHGDRKISVCKRMLEGFTGAGKPTGDPVLIHTLMDVARHLHDSLDSLSPGDEVRQVAALCGRLVELIDMGRDLERQLQVLVDARQSFRNVDDARRRVCLAAVHLTRRALRFVRGKHSKRTAEFMRAAFAFVHISVPGLSRARDRLAIFTIGAESALANNCAPQADALFAAAIAEFADAGDAILQARSGSAAADPTASTQSAFTWGSDPIAIERQVVDAVRRIAGGLIMAPGHPEAGPFHLVRALGDEVRRFPWDPLRGGKARCLLAIFECVATMAQRTLPYHAGPAAADANDALYSGDPEYEEEARELVSEAAEEVLEAVNDLAELAKAAEGSSDDLVSKTLREVLLDVIESVSVHCDLSKPSAAELFFKLFKLAKARGVREERLRTTAAHLVELAQRAAASSSALDTISAIDGSAPSVADLPLGRLAKAAAASAGLRVAWAEA